MRIKTCRICGHNSFVKILHLGRVPPVNYFPNEREPIRKLRQYPLTLCVCTHCRLVQLDEVVPPEKLFRNYHYLTSASQPLIDHFRSLAQECVRRHLVKKYQKVLDIGSNDGTLLLEFKKCGLQPLGVDPSLNAVADAKKIGIKVLPYFFNARSAAAIKTSYGKFHLITGTNVFAHTHNVKSFLKGVKSLLHPHGTLILEFAHLLDMVVKNQFDIIYHEHLSYFSLRPLMILLDQFDLEIFDAKKVLTQGGSLRIYVRSKGKAVSEHSPLLEDILREERENHLDELPTLGRFARDVQQFRTDLRKLVRQIRKSKHRIVGYGAPAKGVILLSYCGFGPSEVQYLVDSTPLKQGRYFPGSGIPVYSERRLENEKTVDYLLLLSWNFQDAILKKIKSLREKGLKVIIPFPKLRVI